MKVYNIKYKGVIYSNAEVPFIRWSNSGSINLDTIPASIEAINEFIEEDDFLELKMGKRIANIVDDNLIIEDIWEKSIRFDKNDFRSTGDKIVNDDISTEKDYLDNLTMFLSKIIITNENVYNYMKGLPSLFNVGKTYDTTIKLNIYNLIIFNLLEFEKIINSDNIKFLEANLSNPKFKVSEASKLNQVIGIPKFAIKEIKKLKLEEAITGIKELSKTIDGNSLKIVFSFLEKMKIFYTKNYTPKNRIVVIDTFLKDISNILSKGYKVNDLLNYLLKQSFYYNNNEFFIFPANEAMYLKDYIRMCEKYGLKYERYPSQIKKMHDIISKNISALDKNSDELEAEFKKSVMEYQEVEREVEIKLYNEDGTSFKKKYTFIVPTSIKDLIQEGNDLHHCVGSYSDLIIDKKSRVVFLRDSLNLKSSLVTIDIDENYRLVEAKKSFNDDPEEEQLKAINKWLREIKKLKL